MQFQREIKKGYYDTVRAGMEILKSALRDLEEGHLENDASDPDAMAVVERLCERFHLVVRYLRKRHNSRSTLDVGDEHDLQDLIRALLAVHFDDIRDEECTPSYAGGASRMDFLLKTERMVIETKMMRKGLNAKKLGEELAIDITRYVAHPDCGTLVCFVYDPEGRCRNPRGLEADLGREDGPFPVRVFIRPL